MFLQASKLNGFWMVEMGTTLNAVKHIWEYDDLDNRTNVRASLGGNEAFLGFLGQIRPMLMSQVQNMCS